MAEDKNKNKKRISVSESEKLLLWEEKEIGKAYDQKPKKDIKPFLIFLAMALVLGGMIFYFSTMNREKDLAGDKNVEVSTEVDQMDIDGQDSKTPDSSEGVVIDGDETNDASERGQDSAKDGDEASQKEDGEEAVKGDDAGETDQASASKDAVEKTDVDGQNQVVQEEASASKDTGLETNENEASEESKQEEVKKPQAVVYRTYKVKPKDTFFNIAMTIYNNKAYVESIKSWNNTTTLKAGTTIKLRPYKNRSMANYAPRYYKIKSGETLFSVSMKFYNEKRMIDAIKLINNIDDITSIRTGTTIQLP